MITANLNEVKTHLSSLVSSVEHQGETVLIQKHGVVVAEIVPVKHGKRSQIKKELADIRIVKDPLISTESEWQNV